MSNGEDDRSVLSLSWKDIAVAVCRSPFLSVKCPSCGESGVLGKWNLLDAKSRETSVDLHCAACGAQESVRIVLPEDAATFYPFERFPLVAEAIAKEIESIAARVQRHVKTMPAAAFTTHPLWAEAKWSATTYQFHPTGEVPPIMGLVFENVEAGLEIFREAECGGPGLTWAGERSGIVRENRNRSSLAISVPLGCVFCDGRVVLSR